MTLYLLLATIAVAGTAFILFYRFYWSIRIEKEYLVDLLRSNGIGDRPETIVKKYYKTQGRNLEEKEVRSLVKQFRHNNMEFFLTMYEHIKHKEKEGLGQ